MWTELTSGQKSEVSISLWIGLNSSSPLGTGVFFFYRLYVAQALVIIQTPQ